MKRQISKLNNIYKPAMQRLKQIESFLTDKHITYTKGFYNNHEINVNNTFVQEIYPIPVISFKLDNLETDIGFDAIINKHYIGFIELTINKEDLLNFNFAKLKDVKFEIYGTENFKQDYYFGDLQVAKNLVQKSLETSFHVGINVDSIEKIKCFIENLCK